MPNEYQKFMEIKPDNQLKDMSTQRLVKYMRVVHRNVCLERLYVSYLRTFKPDNELIDCEKDLEIYENYHKKIKNILSTREHVPRKIKNKKS